ncbi:MAG: DUF1801 domain-containing protein [Bacteroidales bacterium]|nr:DUF1801 domain-containing protein [Bacteroidales bacterium]
MNPKVDKYLIDGCMRCPYGATPDCKVHRWKAELEYLRILVLDSELTEEIKWGVPCYTLNNKNVLLISALKEYCCISFFKGVLLKDSKSLLTNPGQNSQSDRQFRFTKLEQIKDVETDIKQYIQEAIEIEKSGLQVELKKNPEPVPSELIDKFKEDPVFKSAFEALTPGRQRGYVLFFSAPKQSKTRESRIEKSMNKILNGIGLHDKYKC